MAIYSIRDLETLSGIKAHTLRIWEQRYGIIVPQRTATNIRYYSDLDLRILLNIALLRKEGFKISKIAKMTKDEIAYKVADLSDVHAEHAAQLDSLTISMIEMDEYKFDKIISTNIKQIGFERTMHEIINPFLEKLGPLWLTGSINPAQEIFIGNLIRQKVIVAINDLPYPKKPKSTFLVYLPKGEKQELTLLFVHFLLKSKGHKVIYLGVDIAFDDLGTVNHLHQPEYVFTMISEEFTITPVQQYIQNLSQKFDNSTIFLTGYQVMGLSPDNLPMNCKILAGLDEMLNLPA